MRRVKVGGDDQRGSRHIDGKGGQRSSDPQGAIYWSFGIGRSGIVELVDFAY